MIYGLIFIFYTEDVNDGQFQFIEGSHTWSGKKAYSDYSVNQYRITPSEIDINNITHDSKINPDMIKLDQVYEKTLSLIKK